VNLFEHNSKPPRCNSAEQFVRVVIERGIEGALGRDGLAYRGEHLHVGQWVQVPLGKAQKPVGGVVVAAGGQELIEGLDPDRVRTVLATGSAVLSASQVELAQWISRYYICPLGLVIKAMLPGSVKARVGQRTSIVLERTTVALSPEQRAALSPAARAALEQIEALPETTFPIEPRRLAGLAHCTNLGPINKLVAAGALITREQVRIAAADQVWLSDAKNSAPPPTPTEAQAKIIIDIDATLGTHAVHLLRGVTGSGKTEVYLRLIASAIARGQSAIVLVPEIALTPQTVRRFAARFDPSTIAVMHSQLSGAQRHRAWAMCASGEARVLIGPRSAILAPMPSLGLIVVDEEHDSSYKQDQSPRYHGRDVAIKRAQLESAVVLLASATPSLESWHNAAGPSPRFVLHTLTDRVGGGTLPPVHIVDLAQEQRALRGSAPAHGPTIDLVGPTLQHALHAALHRGSQAILLLNRRGEAGYVACASARCGWSMHCESCDVSLTAHRMPSHAARFLRCHHCLAAQRIPRVCPACQGPMILLQPGTQHVEAELEARLNLQRDVDLLRVDSDSMRTGSHYFDALDRFASGKVRVLLGTQMIAKGLDYPNVGLVGVLNADTALNLPDFRAQERTFQLVSQVAGRAGRGDATTFGRAQVIVQTMSPTDPAIVLASQHDYESFASRELALRNAARLPPVTRLARIVARHKSLDKARSLAQSAFDAIQTQLDKSCQLVGPMPCTIARLADRFRFEVLLYAPTARLLMTALQIARQDQHLTSDAEFAIDVDPVSML
jgi:primosomal protein N' (replication factor Y)